MRYNLRLLSMLLLGGVFVGLLTSCVDKQKKQAQLERETAKMLQEIQTMEIESAKVVSIPNRDQQLVQFEEDIQILSQQENKLDKYIEALDMRREALRLKLDEFSKSHPVD